jgi:SRSO17 transposase
MEAKAGARNLEDIAGTVPGGDHQRIHHFVSNSPWDDSKVLDWVGTQADGLPGGLPQSHLIIAESALSKKGDASVGVARQ